VKPLLAIEQDPTLPGLGLLGRSVRARGLPIVSAHAWEGDLDELRPGDFAGIVPLGGSMQSWDEHALPFLGRQRAFLREAVEEGVPVLGICLGGQLLARALGAEVRPAERLEAGWLAIDPTPEAAGDELLRHLQGPIGVYQWHTDVFDLPHGSVRLARSDHSENQAFRYGDRFWGLQFHPEVDAPLFAGWMRNYPDAPAAAGIDRQALEAAIATGSPEFTDALFGAFCAACVSAGG
jgi:GMP synthase (glutamine-hydrolysing)